MKTETMNVRWTETMSLRRIKRDIDYLDPLTGQMRDAPIILQQKWVEVLYPNDRRSPKEEWRDVPLEEGT